jgi:formylglycine-generating enzyme required for sulfatase activity
MVMKEGIFRVKVKSFIMQNTEVTQRDFDRLGKPLGLTSINNKGEWMPINAGYLPALKYANALSEEDQLEPVYTIDEAAQTVTWDETKNGWRLPTEAEWEFAAKGKLSSQYGQNSIREKGYSIWPWGNKPDVSKMNFADSGIRGKVEVGSYQAVTQFKLYDIYGNVAEFVWGNADDNYWGNTVFPQPSDVAVDDPGRKKLTMSTASNAQSAATLKGGNYNESAATSRPASRQLRPFNNGYGDPQWGFRLVRDNTGL